MDLACILAAGGEFQIRFIPESEPDFDFCTRCVLAVDDVLYVADEIHFFASAHSYPDSLSALARLGGHWNQNPVFITQIPVDFPRVVRANADEIFFFRLTERADIDFAENYLHEKADLLPMLEDYEFFKFTKGILDIQRGRCSIEGAVTMSVG